MRHIVATLLMIGTVAPHLMALQPARPASPSARAGACSVLTNELVTQVTPHEKKALGSATTGRRHGPCGTGIAQSDARLRFRDRVSGSPSRRIDLLFDFPIAATELALNATRTSTRSHVFDVASRQDLLGLKRIARAERWAPGDAEDIAFLESRGRRP